MHTVTIQFVFNIDKLISMCEGKKTHRLSLSKIKLMGLNRSSRTGFSWKRYRSTDILFPLLVMETEYQLIDGRHRYFKLLEMGRVYANVIYVSKSDLYDCEI